MKTVAGIVIAAGLLTVASTASVSDPSKSAVQDIRTFPVRASRHRIMPDDTEPTITSTVVVVTSADRSPQYVGDVWDCIANAESTHHNNRGEGFFGFLPSTWESMGFPKGSQASDYDFGTQLDAAKRLLRRSGWGQWGARTRRLCHV